MLIRSWLFVPGDSERKLDKARSNDADALILDLEDSVADSRQDIARTMVRDYLGERSDRTRQQLWVRINALDSELALPDLAAVMAGRPDGIVLPKVSGANEVNVLGHYLSALEAREDISLGSTRILCVATETAASLLNFHSYLQGVTPRLSAMTWGAEDLAAALGASDNRNPRSGDFDDPYLLAKSFCLAACRAIDVQPVGVVYTDYRDHSGFEADCLRDARAGFIGKIAIHPSQPPIANRAFTPSDQDVEHAKRVVAAFDAEPGVGAVGLDGKMLDMPHLKQARNLLALAGAIQARERH